MLGSERKAEQGVIQCSSISLLQERFRQLQRAKEMREKRSSLVLQTLSTHNINNNNNNIISNPNDTNYYYANDSLSIVNDKLESFLPPNYYNQSSLLNNNHHTNGDNDAFLTIWLPLSPSGGRLPSYTRSHVSDVDTTLHL